jgi:hypothetical protein
MRLGIMRWKRNDAMHGSRTAALPGRPRAAGLALLCLAFFAACAEPDGDAIDSAPQAQGEAPSAGARSSADAWLGVDREAMFRAHVERIRAVHAVSEAGLARLGTTWQRELDDVAQLYREAKTDLDAYYALVALANSLHDGHAWLRIDGLRPRGPDVTLPVSVRVEYEGATPRYVVRSGSVLPANASVVSVGGRSMDELEREQRRWFSHGSSPEALREELARALSVRSPAEQPTPSPGTTMTLEVEDDRGRRSAHTLAWQSREASGQGCPPYADPCAANADGDYATAPTFVGLGYCVYSTPDKDARIVRYRSFYYPDTSDPTERACLSKKLPLLSYPLDTREANASSPRALLQRDQHELLDGLARSGVRRVLFDVRENGGGDFDPTFFGAFTSGSYAQPQKSFVFTPHFQEDPSRIRDANVYVALVDGSPVTNGPAKIEAFLRDNPASAASPPIPFYCQTPACNASESSFLSQSNVVFRAAVLTGPRCFSACDDFVAIMRDSGIAKTIGQPTGAGDAPYSYDMAIPLAGTRAASLHLTVGVSFHPGTHTPLEGHPVAIDVLFAPSADNRGRYASEAFARAPF